MLLEQIPLGFQDLVLLFQEPHLAGEGRKGGQLLELSRQGHPSQRVEMWDVNPVFQTAITSGVFVVVVLFVRLLEFWKFEDLEKGELEYDKCLLYINFCIFCHLILTITCKGGVVILIL